MKFDIGTIVIVVSVLVFYLRLIIIQRAKIKNPPQGSTYSRFSILSTRASDKIIAVFGLVFIVIGILLNQNIINIPYGNQLWWLIISLGIVAFSWGFR